MMNEKKKVFLKIIHKTCRFFACPKQNIKKGKTKIVLLHLLHYYKFEIYTNTKLVIIRKKPVVAPVLIPLFP